MNIRDRVHFASEDYVGLNSLAALHLDNNELTSINTCYRLAITNGVGCQLVLGCQKPDCYNRRGRAGPEDNSNGLGKRVAVVIYFYQLQVSEAHVPVEDSDPQMVKVRVKIEKKRLGFKSLLCFNFKRH